jgi:hypothetical protein
MEIVAVTFVWLGCLLPYLNVSNLSTSNFNASEKRRLSTITKSNDKHSLLKKCAFWMVFVLCQSLALLCYQTVHSLAVSILLILVLVMIMWVMLVILSGHFPNRFYRINTGIVGLFWMITAIGMIHVS